MVEQCYPICYLIEDHYAKEPSQQQANLAVTKAAHKRLY